jgi:GalNAc-alpha-(1->4)-GalNAc-alpha-(1->3)-diNAcBac-PP-undecaprenol alpha-1,4-N-acetyl-D-galactosaminyltransferase
MIRKEINKRIVFVIGSMRRGGAERVISILANQFADKGWDVQIIALLDGSNDYILRDSIKVTTINDKRKTRIQQLPSWLIKLRTIFKKYNPDVIVSFIARINILTLIASLGLNKKTIISERNDPKSDGRSMIVKLATYLI